VCFFLGWEELYLMCFFLGRGGKLVVMCEEMLFMEENVCQKKNMEGSCV
jgi:hypothetical protein